MLLASHCLQRPVFALSENSTGLQWSLPLLAFVAANHVGLTSAAYAIRLHRDLEIVSVSGTEKRAETAWLSPLGQGGSYPPQRNQQPGTETGIPRTPARTGSLRGPGLLPLVASARVQHGPAPPSSQYPTLWLSLPLPQHALSRLGRGRPAKTGQVTSVTRGWPQREPTARLPLPQARSLR